MGRDEFAVVRVCGRWEEEKWKERLRADLNFLYATARKEGDCPNQWQRLPLLTTVIGWRPRKTWDENGAARVDNLRNFFAREGALLGYAIHLALARAVQSAACLPCPKVRRVAEMPEATYPASRHLQGQVELSPDETIRTSFDKVGTYLKPCFLLHSVQACCRGSSEIGYCR